MNHFQSYDYYISFLLGIIISKEMPIKARMDSLWVGPWDKTMWAISKFLMSYLFLMVIKKNPVFGLHEHLQILNIRPFVE